MGRFLHYGDFFLSESRINGLHGSKNIGGDAYGWSVSIAAMSAGN